MKRVILHIDNLVLKGFRHEDRRGIATGLQHELSSLFADPQAVQQLTSGGDLSQLQVGSVSVGQGVKPHHIGQQVARGIGKGVEK